MFCLNENSAPAGVTSEERATYPRPVVEPTVEGASRLGSLYWEEVERFMRGVVRAHASRDGLQLRIPGGPVLLGFRGPLLDVSDGHVTCLYDITGGLLARAPGGQISFHQEGSGPTQVRSAIADYHPRLGARPRRPRWFGALYQHVQVRVHVAISRQYFARLAREARA